VSGSSFGNEALRIAVTALREIAEVQTDGVFTTPGYHGARWRRLRAVKALDDLEELLEVVDEVAR
jgi:hypothetical protein